MHASSEPLRANAASVPQEVTRVLALPAVREAFSWLSSQANELLEQQIAITKIAAPPFQEARRADWLRRRFQQLGLAEARTDEIGNVLAVRPGADPRDRARYVAITAHLDTVFPADTPLDIRRDGLRAFGPGISDNGAGLTAMLAIAEALQRSRLRNGYSLLFVGNVGEEGEGDVRGMRHLFSDPQLRDAIDYTLVLDGAGTDTIVTEALGSRRFDVTVSGPGGHSWSDFGVPNPIIALARAVELFSNTPVPTSPKTAFNIGVISGGTSVNSIPENASMRVDIRSASSDQILRLERALRDAVERSMVESRATAARNGAADAVLRADLRLIGDRPAAKLSPGSRVLAVLRAVDNRLGNTARVQRASTDANIPLALGRDAVAVGAGGTGGGAHTLHEWYDATDRQLGLERILTTVLTLAGAGE